MQNTFGGWKSLSQGSHMCTGTQGRNLNPDSSSHVGLSGDIDQQLALVLCGNRGAPRDRGGEKAFRPTTVPSLLSTELKENYIPCVVAAYY